MFTIHFDNPWWLLLLIPAVAFTLIPYFRLSKKYRRTRNRISSIVLHLLVMLFSITLLAGIEFWYFEPNTRNQIILLVDVSDTEETQAEKRDEFVETVLSDGRFGNYNIGVVTFGFDQVYAVPFTTDVDDIYDLYKGADLPDVSATNMASALKFAKNKFSEDFDTAKIVLITDAKETDEEALKVIRSISSQGISVDVAYIPSSYAGMEAQAVGVELPDYHVTRNMECSITLYIKSNTESTRNSYVTIYDNGKAGEKVEVQLNGGDQKVVFRHRFDDVGLHELNFKIDAATGEDTLEMNNSYSVYYNLEVFNKILVLQRESDASDDLIEMLNENFTDPADEYKITPRNIMEEGLPETLNDLLDYDQIILNNIAQTDMPKEFQEILKTYVKDCGGGLFTLGGTDKDGNAHAYNHNDLSLPSSIYQEMLPVRITDYTPPVAVMLIIDRSGSMSAEGTDKVTFLESAKAGAAACMNALDDKDYMGIMTLDSDYGFILGMTPATRRSDIRNAIYSIDAPGGGTEFTPAIERAAEELMSTDVAKRHIIIVTDGMPGDKIENYGPVIEQYYQLKKITVSVVGVGIEPGSGTAIAMQKVVDAVGENVPDSEKGRVYTVSSANALTESIKADLQLDAITSINEDPFLPIIANGTSPLVQDIERGEGTNNNKMTVTLGGFFGVEARDASEVILKGDFDVPIYAQWKFGEGRVGSFMCDLQSSGWSQDFVADKNGRTFIRNVVNNLMPLENIIPTDVRVNLYEDNYTNTLDVITELAEGETIRGEVRYLSSEGVEKTVSLNEVSSSDSPCYVTTAITSENRYSRCVFVAKQAGVYTITIEKIKADGKTVASTKTLYKDFSYSKEYDAFTAETNEALLEKVTELASKGDGVVIKDLDDPWEIFEDFVTDLERIYDPRTLFMILAIVFFLLDIAVRKFKFKWPHEIIRAYKNKKASK